MRGLDRDALVVSVADTVRLFTYYDSDGDGLISYSEFMRLLQNSTPIDYTPLVVGENQRVTMSGAASPGY